MNNEQYKEIKEMTSYLFSLCNKLWPDEFREIYLQRSAVFRDWMNEKTGLSEDHLKHKKEALMNWIKKLEHML